MSSTNPSTLFGGTWSQIKDRFLLSIGDTYKTAEATGGEATHTLTKAELPNIMLQGTTDNVSLTMNNAGYAVFKLWGKNTSNLLSQNLGSGKAHNNMPPYITVYMWKRVS